METGEPGRYVISVLVADRVGILRDITSAITDMNANIDGISQTVVEGYFTVILTATFSPPRTAEAIRSAILQNFARDEAAVVVGLYAQGRPSRPAQGDLYIVTLTGPDSRGILKAVTGFLASREINIEDWYVQFEGPNVTHIGEITVPERLDIKQLQDEFRQLLVPFGLGCFLQHENIFRATNEIGPIERLLR